MDVDAGVWRCLPAAEYQERSRMWQGLFGEFAEKLDFLRALAASGIRLWIAVVTSVIGPGLAVL